MAEKEIEKLVNDHLRRELDEIAEGLGLKPSTYPNKRAAAEAIVKARRARERGKMEKNESMKRSLKGSVKDKVNDIQRFIKQSRQYTHSMQSKIKAMQAETRELQSDILALQKDLHEGTTSIIRAGTKAMQAGVKEVQAGIQDKKNVFLQTQAGFNQYTREFYG